MIEQSFDLTSSFKNGRSNYVKILWIIMLCFSVFGLFYYVKECYEKLKVSPEILINEKLVNSRAIPFPAVTICPPFGVKKELLKDVVREYPTPFCYDFNALGSVKDLYLKSLNTSLKELFDAASPQISDVLDSCGLSGYPYYFKCDHVYTRILTNFGYCFTFNMLNFSSIFPEDITEDMSSYKKPYFKGWVEEVVDENDKESQLFYSKANENAWTLDAWSLEKGYASKNELVKPLRATLTQKLRTRTKQQFHDDFDICENVFKVIFHLPTEVPSSLNLAKEFGSSKSLSFSAHISKHDETLKQFPPEERGCYFEGEKKLKFFKSYTNNNCEHECMINYTLIKCDSVEYSMPRTKDIQMCDDDLSICFYNIFAGWPISFYTNETNQELYPDNPCDCMPSCTQIKYEFLEKEVDRETESIGTKSITLNMNFESSQILITTHYVTYKLHNFICDIGGLAGLFLGFSLLSMFEMVLNFFAIMFKIIAKLFRMPLNENEFDVVNEISVISSRTESNLTIVDLEDLD
ncbi:unnamed protein product [Chironomus riparius]|uniref:Uncharacterized protein n=1 Tax=Chironomus riparius TaxID=315576 RepID=A0A9N9WN87_9DIPT|nr:unnamed protein product [Chironomus riparius]